MKTRFFVGLLAVAALGMAAAPAASTYMADAIGVPGTPTVAVSNPGSTAGQAHRSQQGSTMKATHDGAVYILD